METATPLVFSVTTSQSFEAGSVSFIKVVPTSGAGQATITLGDGTGVTLAAGASWEFDSGDYRVKNSLKILVTATAGTLTVSGRA